MAASSPSLLSFSLLALLLLCPHLAAGCRLLPSSSFNILLSDGGGDANSSSSFVSGLSMLARSEEAQCEQTYGFLPCTTTVAGNLFLVVAYGFLMFKAATYLSAGSELLLEILGPGIVGGLFLPILGALPDAMLVLGKICF